MKLGLISGSFDPLTLGHEWVVNEARRVCTRVVVVIAQNDTKTSMFGLERRIDMLTSVLNRPFGDLAHVKIKVLPAKMMLVDYAKEIGASAIFRGLRNSIDFEYEHSIDLLQAERYPELRSLYLMTPRKYTEVSSSLIKQLIKLDGWGSLVSRYVPPEVYTSLLEVAVGKP